MANALMQRPWNFEVANVGNFTQPLQKGIDDSYALRQQGVENERQNKLIGFQEKRLGMDQGRFGMDQQRFSRDMALRDQTDPLSVDQARLGLDQTRAQIGATQANAAETYGNQRRADEQHRAQMSQLDAMTPKQRLEIAPRLGINDPNQAQQFAYRYAPKPNTFDLGPDHTRFEVRPGINGASTAVQIATGGQKSKSDEAYLTEMAKGDAKQIQDMVSSYPAIQQNLGKVGVMRQLSEQIGNPGIANTVANSRLGQAARAVGLAPEQMSTIEGFTSMVNQLVPAQRPPGSGTMSDKDVELFRGSIANVAQTKEGRDFILAQSEAINRYDEARARIAQDIRAERIGRREGMDKMMSLPNPLAGLEQNLKQFGIAGAGRPVQAQQQGSGIPQGAVQMLMTNPGLAADFDAKYGPGAAARAMGGAVPQQRTDSNGIPYPPASR